MNKAEEILTNLITIGTALMAFLLGYFAGFNLLTVLVGISVLVGAFYICFSDGFKIVPDDEGGDSND